MREPTVGNQRTNDFRRAAESYSNMKVVTACWSDVAPDPNDPLALAHRAAQLQRAFKTAIRDRVSFLEQRCQDKLVLDIGCVAHDLGRLSSPEWVHGRISRAAKRCIGVDVLPDAVDELNRRGYEAVDCDLTKGLGPIAQLAPFDVIVAGELIEHVEKLGMLFEVASHTLAPHGELIITTPNPYAPQRVWAGRRGVVWENADHIMYAFPSGIAELADRYGLSLSEFMSTRPRPLDNSPRGLAKRALRRWRGTRWIALGYPATSAAAPIKIRGRLYGRIADRLTPSPRLLGETNVYVVRRAVTTSLLQEP